MASPLIINSLSNLSHSKGKIILEIKTQPAETGISLIELLSALDTIRHSQNLKLVGLTSASPDSYEFFQAVSQVKWYYPAVKTLI
jgi:hypothetical protein